MILCFRHRCLNYSALHHTFNLLLAGRFVSQVEQLAAWRINTLHLVLNNQLELYRKLRARPPRTRRLVPTSFHRAGARLGARAHAWVSAPASAHGLVPTDGFQVDLGDI